ncbi:MAG: hypothetical protein WA902_07065 [Thermosynechococcaceae cyanobacterium]
MRLNSVLILIASVATASPALAQGIFVTTVNNSSVTPVGRQSTNLQFVKSEQTINNDVSVTTNVQSDSNTNTQQQNGVTTTDTTNVGSIATSTASERGTTTRTEAFEYSETFEYVDYETSQNVTTGANGDSGPEY